MILFVGSNPSHLNNNPHVPFYGSRSEKNFKEWTARLVPNGNYKVVNVSDALTPHNRPLRKDEFDLLKLCNNALDPEITKIVALGNTASIALDMIGIKYFKLPHPSPLNRKLNNKYYIEAVLEECEKWLK